MNVDKAIEQISDIHSHLARTETFRGYRAATVLGIGVIAFLIASFQSLSEEPIPDLTLIIQWAVTAGIIALGVAGKMFYDVLIRGTSFQKHQTVKVFLQFMPSLIAGFLITVIFIYHRIPALKLLPGIWSILFGLGIFSMRPYLPKFTGCVALYYLVAGCALLCLVPSGKSLSPWSMGITFGTGNVLGALVLQSHTGRHPE